MQTSRTRIMAEMGLCIALFTVLQYFSIRLPINALGGTISLAMVPIVVISLLRGPLVGIACGAACGLVDITVEPFILHPIQAVLDYPIAFGLVGLAGLFSGWVADSFQNRTTIQTMVGVGGAAIVGVAGRFLAAFISGLVFFQSSFPDASSPLVYSAFYNASYLAPSLVVTMVVSALVMPVLIRTVKGATDG